MDYLVYAHLQLGEDAEAKRVVAEGLAINTINPAVFIGPYGQAAMPARYALERRSWKEAAALEEQPSRFAFTAAITHFARGLGFARSGDPASAQKEADRLAVLRDALKEQKNTYWANQTEVQRLAVSAWVAFARGSPAEALTAMRASADLEDSMEKHIVTPAPVVPARELLGEMLLEAKRPAEALAAFEAAAQREPNRLRGLYGAAQAAAQSGDRAKAKMYYEKLAALAAGTGRARPELQQARAYLAQR
jgi:predicted Zn-dependent protease